MVNTGNSLPEDEDDGQGPWHLLLPQNHEENDEDIFTGTEDFRQRMQAGFDNEVDPGELTILEVAIITLKPKAEANLLAEIPNLRTIESYKKTHQEDNRFERYSITIIQQLLRKGTLAKASLLTMLRGTEGFDENTFNRAWSSVGNLNKQ